MMLSACVMLTVRVERRQLTAIRQSSPTACFVNDSLR